MPDDAVADRVRAVWTRLGAVTDPELDEPVTELGFVTSVAVDAESRVHIRFRLPTYWCAANFAFLMADDMRRAASALPWVRGVTVELGEHMVAEAINDGMARGLGFRDTFGEEATDDLEEVRRTFLVKSFQRRQEDLLRSLLAAGHAPADLLRLNLRDLDALEDAQGLVRRYRDRRGLAGPDRPDDPAFVAADGSVPDAAGFAAHLAVLRRVRINTEFNGHLCRSLLAARFGDDPPDPNAEPTLRDFIRAAAREG
jgi:metal-sulfur cluster biosynthetic enzyme